MCPSSSVLCSLWVHAVRWAGTVVPMGVGLEMHCFAVGLGEPCDPALLVAPCSGRLRLSAKPNHKLEVAVAANSVPIRGFACEAVALGGFTASPSACWCGSHCRFSSDLRCCAAWGCAAGRGNLKQVAGS